MQPTKSIESASASTLAWWRCPGLVYFLAVGEPPIAVKIGMLAVTPKTNVRSAMARRLSHIQSANHELVQVLGVIPFASGDHPTKDAEDRERQLHTEFAHLARFKANTRGAEWFNASTALLARVQEVAQSPEAAGVPRTVGQWLTQGGGEV